MTVMDEIRERIARALYLRRTGCVPFMWDTAGDNTRGMFIGDADAVLEALAPELALIKQARWERQQSVGF